ncbi:serine/threonine-protein kinase 16-like [Pempheris klunzingeri]|uniref:serine/threonine-protein kinase 16-like n=1 Tax=Pempheris klunzingeri TaxID=3127111 RepID=UPI00398073C7
MGQILCGIRRQKTYTINNIVYKKERCVGEGAFSYVYLVKMNGNSYALKLIPLLSAETEKIAKTEVYICKTIQHESICCMIDHEMITQSNGLSTALLLFKYYNGPNLSNFSGKLDGEILSDYFHQILKAIEVLHCKFEVGFIHNDIKDSNFMLTSDDGGRTYRVVLIDLGSCKATPIYINSRIDALRYEEIFRSECTMCYRAPELFEVPNPSVLGLESDIWSLGCTLYSLAYGYPPFNGTALSAVSANIKFPSNHQYKYHPIVKQMITIMCNPNPEQRPTISDLIDQYPSL